MVESRSMVRGASPGPASVDQARAINSRLTRSSWRTWPHRKLRRNVPRVDGALTVPPGVRAVPPGAQHIGVVNAVAARQCRRNQGHHLVARVRPARGIAPGRGAAGRVDAGAGGQVGSSPPAEFSSFALASVVLEGLDEEDCHVGAALDRLDLQPMVQIGGYPAL